MISISAAERRARIALRQHLAPEYRVDSMVEAARGVVGLHATDPASVYLSTWARMRQPSSEAIARELYEERRLIRILAMRRTLFVVPTEDVPILQAAASLGVARTERRRNEQLAELLGVEDPDGWMRAAEAATMAALEERGEATAAELSRAVPALAHKVRVNIGKPYEGDLGISSRVLILLALEGRVVRGRPRGTWLSSQYRWATTERWLGRPLPILDEAEAQAQLMARWLARFGPGTEADMRWWSGLTARDVRAALAAVGAGAVDLDGTLGYVLPGDTEASPVPQPWVALLPSLDPTTMGWQARDWYLGAHKEALFDSSGNAGPTIWMDGRIVGGWSSRPGGAVVTGLLEDVGREAGLAIEAEAARLAAWLGPVRVMPRFPTPYHRALASA
jgi:hypothetical protein